MKKTMIIAAMAALLPATAVWAGDKDEAMRHAMGNNTHGAMSNTTPHAHGHRLEEGEKQSNEKYKKMTHKMSDKERGPMVESYKRGSDRLQGKRETMQHKMNGKKHGAMSDTTPHEHGHRLD